MANLINRAKPKKHVAFSVTVANIIARGGHLILFVSIGNRYGVNNDTDMVFFLYAPLMVILSVSTGVADTIVMPAMHRAYFLRCSNIIQRVLRWRLVGLVVPASIASLAVVWIIDRNAPISLVILLLPIPICGSLASFYSGLLNAHGRYVEAILGPLYGCVISIPLVFILPNTVYSLAFLLLLFEITKVAGMLIIFYKNNIISDDNVEMKMSVDTIELVAWATNNAKWQILGSLLVALNPMIDILFANTLGSGSVTSVEYANRLWNMVYVFFAGHLTLLYAAMSKQNSQGKIEYKNLHASAIKVGSIALLTAVVMILVLADPIISLMYGMGTMGHVNIVNLSGLLKYYFIGIAPYIGGLVYVRALSAEGRTKELTKIALLSLGLNALMDALLIPFMGINGIGLATSAVYVMVSIKLAYRFKL